MREIDNKLKSINASARMSVVAQKYVQIGKNEG